MTLVEGVAHCGGGKCVDLKVNFCLARHTAGMC
jgi:hypothetical protein